MRHFLRVSDRFPIEATLDIDTEYKIESVVGVASIEKKSDEEGGFDFIHKVKFMGPITLTKGNVIIRTRDKKKYSQAMKFEIIKDGLNYEDFMAWILATQIDDLKERFIGNV